MRFPDRQARGKPDLQERLSCSHRNRSRGRRACVCVDISSSSWENPRCFVLRVRCMSACVDSRLGPREGQQYTRNREGKRVFETRERHSTAAFLSPSLRAGTAVMTSLDRLRVKQDADRWGSNPQGLPPSPDRSRVCGVIGPVLMSRLGCHGVVVRPGLSREIKVK